MSRTTQDPVTLGREALAAGKHAWPRPSGGTELPRAQPFALCVPRRHYGLAEEGLIRWLIQWPRLRQALELRHVPGALTLLAAERRLESEGALNPSRIGPAPGVHVA